MELDVKIK
jgi:hypothetical protein